jgi:hypothetical protein
MTMQNEDPGKGQGQGGGQGQGEGPATQDPPIDPVVLSMIRWFANAIENRCIEKYWALRTNDKDIRLVLQQVMHHLGNLPSSKALAGEMECPWDCRNPPCTPMC